MDINRIMEILPHRYPMLLVDRILEVVPGEHAVGIKNVTINEDFFQGHFPGHPVMPGVLIVESMAQVAGILAYETAAQQGRDRSELEDTVVYFMSIDKVKFRRPVVPGDQLRHEVRITKMRKTMLSIAGKAYVGEVLVSEGEMMAIIVDREEAAEKAGKG